MIFFLSSVLQFISSNDLIISWVPYKFQRTEHIGFGPSRFVYMGPSIEFFVCEDIEVQKSSDLSLY